MRKCDELTTPNSCLNKARNTEWLFVLLGRDAAAPAAVNAWIEERIRLGKNKPDDEQIIEARRWIEMVEMEQGFRSDIKPSRLFSDQLEREDLAQ